MLAGQVRSHFAQPGEQRELERIEDLKKYGFEHPDYMAEIEEKLHEQSED
jgi:hypothetical protein